MQQEQQLRLNYTLLASIFESAMEGPREKKLFSSLIQNNQQLTSVNQLLYTIVTRAQGYRAFLNFVHDKIQKYILEVSPRDVNPPNSATTQQHHHYPYHSQSFPITINRASPMSSPRQMNMKQYTLVTEYNFVTVFQEIFLLPDDSSGQSKQIEEYKLLDIFDTLDTQGRGVVKIRDMYMVLVCLVAKQGNILTKFLYQFGDYIYNMFRTSNQQQQSGSSEYEDPSNAQQSNQQQSVMKIEHVCKLATIAQTDASKVQRQMNKVLQSSKLLHHTEEIDSISKEDYMLIYYAVFSSDSTNRTKRIPST